MILTLPAPLTVYDIDWLSIWSKRIGRSLAHVDVHRMALNVPPALEELVNPKSELNCETLDSSLGLQLRWSLTDETSADPAILLQLVANTGSDRYLAIGIRSRHPCSKARSRILSCIIISHFLFRIFKPVFEH